MKLNEIRDNAGATKNVLAAVMNTSAVAICCPRCS